MKPQYVPILKAKKGEFSALRNLHVSVASRCTPLFDLPAPDTRSAVDPGQVIGKVARAMGQVWAGKEAFIDISRWRPDARTDDRVHILLYAVAAIMQYGVEARAVVAYDRWDDREYSQALISIAAMYGPRFCLRLNAEALEDMRDVDYFQERLEEIVNAVGMIPAFSTAIVDLGDVGHASVADLLAQADLAINLLRSNGFTNIVVAGGSMPGLVNEAVGMPNEVGMVNRIEMLLWKALYTGSASDGIIFGDYGIRNAKSMDGVISKHANGKIRYTVGNQFYILRGESKQLTRLGLQHKALAARLVSSPYYMTENFSWGDHMAAVCSDPSSQFMGGATEWIAIDTNHHIAAVAAEIYEHQQRVAAKSEKSSA